MVLKIHLSTEHILTVGLQCQRSLSHFNWNVCGGKGCIDEFRAFLGLNSKQYYCIGAFVFDALWYFVLFEMGQYKM